MSTRMEYFVYLHLTDRFCYEDLLPQLKIAEFGEILSGPRAYEKRDFSPSKEAVPSGSPCQDDD